MNVMNFTIIRDNILKICKLILRYYLYDAPILTLFYSKTVFTQKLLK